MQLQLNCIGDKSRQRVSSLQLTLIDCPALFSVAQSLFETQQTATAAQGSYTLLAQKTLSANTYKQKEVEGNYIPPMPGLLTKKWKCKQMV